MSKTRAFEIAQLIRHIRYSEENDTIELDKSTDTPEEGTLTTTDATTQTLDTFLKDDYVGAKYNVSVSDSTLDEYELTELQIVHDGTDAYITQFGTILSNDNELSSFTADISGNDVRLRITPTSASSKVFTFTKIEL